MDTLRERLLARRPKVAPIVDVPGWEGAFVRAMPASAMSSIRGYTDAPDGLERLVVMAVVDENGDAIFIEEDVPDVGKLPISELNEVVRQFNDLNAFSENGRAALGKDSS